MTTDEKDAEIAALKAQAFADREAVANLALDMGFSTGHGDTIADILLEVRPQIEKMKERWTELEPLVYAVGKKYPSESRIETALRYIRQAESLDEMQPQQEPKQ